MKVCFCAGRVAMRKLIYPGVRNFDESHIHFGESILFLYFKENKSYNIIFENLNENINIKKGAR